MAMPAQGFVHPDALFRLDAAGRICHSTLSTADLNARRRTVKEGYRWLSFRIVDDLGQHNAIFVAGAVEIDVVRLDREAQETEAASSSADRTTPERKARRVTRVSGGRHNVRVHSGEVRDACVLHASP